MRDLDHFYDEFDRFAHGRWKWIRRFFPRDWFARRLLRGAYASGPHGAHITRYAMYAKLYGRLAHLDQADKRALIISGSEPLANVLGLTTCRRVSVAYPEYTLENLAFLDDSFDFVVSDQVLEHCAGPLTDVASEVIRVLRPGGWFVHTSCFMNPVHGSPHDFWRFTPYGLEEIFRTWCAEVTGEGWGNRAATHLMEAGYRLLPVPNDPRNPVHRIAMHNEPDWPISVWVTGRKAEEGPRLTPTVHTRKASKQRANGYRFDVPATPVRLGLIACARNEAPYLLEWVAYHRLLGFQHITIYDNESNDATHAILGPLSRAGEVNAVYWSSPENDNKQTSAYTDATKALKEHVEWAAFIDLDEFILLADGFRLESLIPVDPTVSAVGVPWRMFGSAGHRYRQPCLTIERFTRTSTAFAANDCVKSIVRLRDVHFMNVHVPRLERGRIVDVAGEEISYESEGVLKSQVTGPARINHYFTRSWEEFECKRARGRGAVVPGAPDSTRDASWFVRMDFGEVEDRAIAGTAAAVREEIARLRKTGGFW